MFWYALFCRETFVKIQHLVAKNWIPRCEPKNGEFVLTPHFIPLCGIIITITIATTSVFFLLVITIETWELSHKILAMLECLTASNSLSVSLTCSWTNKDFSQNREDLPPPHPWGKIPKHHYSTFWPVSLVQGHRNTWRANGFNNPIKYVIVDMVGDGHDDCSTRLYYISQVIWVSA